MNMNLKGAHLAISVVDNQLLVNRKTIARTANELNQIEIVL